MNYQNLRKSSIYNWKVGVEDCVQIVGRKPNLFKRSNEQKVMLSPKGQRKECKQFYLTVFSLWNRIKGKKCLKNEKSVETWSKIYRRKRRKNSPVSTLIHSINKLKSCIFAQIADTKYPLEIQLKNVNIYKDAGV